jgi:hypothetical protein
LMKDTFTWYNKTLVEVSKLAPTVPYQSYES